MLRTLVARRSFKEWPSNDVISRELSILLNAIGVNPNIENTVFYVAAYQPPLFIQFWDMHYEIVLMIL